MSETNLVVRMAHHVTIREGEQVELRSPSPATGPIYTEMVPDTGMSGNGTKRTCPAHHIMSVLGGKADIMDAVSDFRS